MGFFKVLTDQVLLESARKFLVESLDNFSKGKYDFAIIHAVTAVELTLKARLIKIHPSLVFKNIDSKSFGKEQTIALRQLPQRLKNLGVHISSDDIDLIKLFADWRNSIVHFMPSFDKDKASVQFPELIDFLAKFLRTELEMPIENLLPKTLYKTALDILEEWNRIVEDAVIKAKREGNTLPEACPYCGARGVLCLREDDSVFCHLCHSQNYIYDECVQCGCKTLVISSPVESERICSKCIENAGEQYIQMYIDALRGK
jgi:hypothetical protein